MGNMNSGNGGENKLLQRIDAMIEELHLIRREVANLLVERADCEVRASQCANTVMSLEELYARDFGEKPRIETDNIGETTLEVPHETAAKTKETEGFRSEGEGVQNEFDELLHTAAPQQLMNDLFVPVGSDELLDDIFEEQSSFKVADLFSLADRYMYANHLFGGDTEALAEALTDIERLSSRRQVESYLYDVLRLKKDDEEVKEFARIILERTR